MAEDKDEKKKRRIRQQATIPYTPATTSTVAPPTYLPPTRTPAAPSGTPTTSTTAAPTPTTAPPATLPPKSTTTSTAPKSTTTTTPKSPTTTEPQNTGPRSADGATSWRQFEEDTSPKDDGKGGKGGKGKGGKGGKGKGGKETAPETPPAEPTLEDNVRKFYPQYAYLLDNPELFGDDVIRVIRRAVKDGWTKSRFEGSIMATKYWQNTVQEAKNFDALTMADKDMKVQDTLDEINTIMDTSAFDSDKLSTFARDMARRGITGEQLKKMTYSLALQEGSAPEAQADVLESNDAIKIKQYVRAYGGSVSDEVVKQYLADGMTPQRIQMMYREKAKGLYPHLAAQFDADLTFEDIIKDYKSIAANVLEKTESEIDFTKPEFLEAIASDDGKGNKRQLSLGEWQKKLKTDDRYGYSKTTQAIQDARQIAFNIGRAFGKVL